MDAGRPDRKRLLGLIGAGIQQSLTPAMQEEEAQQREVEAWVADMERMLAVRENALVRGFPCRMAPWGAGTILFPVTGRQNSMPLLCFTINSGACVRPLCTCHRCVPKSLLNELPMRHSYGKPLQKLCLPYNASGAYRR